MTTQAPLDGRDLAVVESELPRVQLAASKSAAHREHRAAATTAGILYLVGTASGVLSGVVTAQVKDATDPLQFADTHQGVIATGALLVLLMGLSLAFIPVVLLPVLRRVDEVLAFGYLVIRGAVETVSYVLIAVGWLLLVPLAGVVEGSAGARTGVSDLLVNADAANAVGALVFCLGATMFYVLLFRSRIVPRWISGWGLAAIPLYVAAALLAMYGVIGANSTAQVLLFVPLGLQELVLAIWMIARGFRPAAPPPTDIHVQAR